MRSRRPGGKGRGDLRRLMRDPAQAALIVLVLASITLFIVYPLASVVLQGFRTDTGWSARIFVEVAKSAYLRSAFLNSLLMSGLTATIGTLIGFIFAFAVTRADVPMKKFLNAVAIIPIVSPPFIGALAIIMLFGNSGFVTWTILRIQNFPIYGFRGLLVAQVLTFFPRLLHDAERGSSNRSIPCLRTRLSTWAGRVSRFSRA